jgi:aryl-alcohol dehydrogenase-like predicted oxidoreductase
MQTRTLGAGGPPVSPVGFGAMKLSIDGRPTEGEALRVLCGALDAGIDLIDTADVYSLDAGDLGHNERLVARALEAWGGDRERVLVATKGGSSHPERTRWQPDGRPEHLRAACEASLRALRRERIDLWFLHAVDPRVPYERSLEAVAGLVESGKVRWVGVSNVGPRELALARRHLPLRAVQNMLNPYRRADLRRDRSGLRGRLGLGAHGVVEQCRRLGLAYLAHSPMGSWWSASLPEHPVVAPIAARHGVSPHAIALARVLAQGEHVIALPGSRRLERVLEAVRAAELELDAAELEALDRARFET